MQEPHNMIECTYSSKQMPYMIHYHNAHEIVFVQAGHVEFIINNRAYQVGPGNLVFISNMEEHQMRVIHGEYLRYYALFSSRQLLAMLGSPLLCSPFLSRSTHFNHVFCVDSITEQITSLFQLMASEMSSAEAFSQDVVASAFQQLMILCYRSNPQYFDHSPHCVKSVLLDIQRYIDEHLSEKLSVSSLANQFFLSESYFSHIFKDWTGFSPQRYIIMRRISLAKDLLSSQNLSLDIVADRCGYTATSQFISSFKKETGLTPGQFRKNLRSQAAMITTQ